MKSTFKDRLKELMNYNGLKQIDIIRKTGLDKSLISCYLSGKYSATQDNVYLIAKSFDVSPAWLMGFDVPMKEPKQTISLDDLVDLILNTLEDKDTPRDMKRDILRKILLDNEYAMRKAKIK